MRYCSKTLVLMVAVTLPVVPLRAAQRPFSPSFNSAPTGSVQFSYDVDTLIYTPAATFRFYYRDTSVSTWSQIPMSSLYQACSTITISGILNFTPPSGKIEYYYRTEVDSAVVSESPKNALNAFPVPVNLLADMGADPTGDTVNALGQWLDITGCQMNYSDTRLFARLTNAGGGFPTSSGLNFFIYSVGIVNPDQTDSVGYAMIYVNVPLVLSAGLYKVNPVDTSFTKIGNITTNISGNALSMACNISDLTAQTGFGPWPNASGFVITAPLTGTQTLSGLTLNDVGKGGVFVPGTHHLDYSAVNNAPVLSSPLVTTAFPNKIKSGIAYSDADNHLPVLRDIVINSIPHPMLTCAKTYQTGSSFAFDTTVGATGWYKYHFAFSDGKDTITTVEDSVFVAVYVPGDANNDGNANISDAVFIIAYIFASGPAPNPIKLGDENCDGLDNISDAVYLIAYIFAGGTAPCN